MDIRKLVTVKPNGTGTTLTAYSQHDNGGKNLGHLLRGQVFIAVEDYKSSYRLIEQVNADPSEQFQFPHEGYEVWASKAYLPDYSGDPEPAPVSDKWKSLAGKLGHALIEWSEE